MDEYATSRHFELALLPMDLTFADFAIFLEFSTGSSVLHQTPKLELFAVSLRSDSSFDARCLISVSLVVMFFDRHEAATFKFHQSPLYWVGFWVLNIISHDFTWLSVTQAETVVPGFSLVWVQFWGRGFLVSSTGMRHALLHSTALNALVVAVPS
jgi:hypothetical protein